jgi:hypothetical protein
VQDRQNFFSKVAGHFPHFSHAALILDGPFPSFLACYPPFGIINTPTSFLLLLRSTLSHLSAQPAQLQVLVSGFWLRRLLVPSPDTQPSRAKKGTAAATTFLSPNTFFPSFLFRIKTSRRLTRPHHSTSHRLHDSCDSRYPERSGSISCIRFPPFADGVDKHLQKVPIFFPGWHCRDRQSLPSSQSSAHRSVAGPATLAIPHIYLRPTRISVHEIAQGVWASIPT